MHKQEDITIENLSKIEGHAEVVIKIKNKKVKKVHFNVVENKRFYTQAIRGKHFRTVSQLVPRICGTCSIAHLVCCIEAIEKTLKVNVSEQTKILRRLLMNGLIIRDHALHLYLFTLPDVFNVDSVLEFNKEKQKYLHDGFKVKAAGNKLDTVVGGRAVHATYPAVGGFTHFPSKTETKEVIKALKEARPAVLQLIDVYFNCPLSFERETNFVALVAEDYNFIGERMHSSKNICIEKENYLAHLEKTVLPYSESIGYKLEGEDFMVGALSRMNLNKNSLNKKTKKDCKKYLKEFPSKNIYHNNLAQAIEILHCIDDSIEILEGSDFKPEPLSEVKAANSVGVGIIEAPRGTLYYKLQIEENGKIKNGNIVVPTSQNQVNIRDDIKKLVEEKISKPKKELAAEIEKLIRAYDPCMSCAAHFVKLKIE
jgi:coenzyme F420-reducing hydrogenase alpha subunit